jgi:hypothetical protein
MSNKKIIVKRRNNIAKSNNNAVGNLLKALKKPMQMPKRNKPTRGFKSLAQESGFSKNIRMEAPVAFGSITKVTKPNFGRARTVIKHSEYIGDINGSANFTVQQTIAGNPGLPNSFPWLAQIANAYEKHKILRVSYRFETEAPTTYTGSVFLSPEFNPQDLAPLSKMETFQNEDTVRTVPWRGVCCQIPAKYLKVYNDYFVRSGPLAVNIDLKTYDPYILYVCTQGQANANLAGEIWVDYEVELINPIGNLVYGGGSYYANSVANMSATVLSPPTTVVGPLQIIAGPITGGYATFTISSTVIGQEYLITAWLYGGTVITVFSIGANTGGALNSDSVNCINAAATSASAYATIIATATSINFKVEIAATTVAIFGLAATVLPTGSGF